MLVEKIKTRLNVLVAVFIIHSCIQVGFASCAKYLIAPLVVEAEKYLVSDEQFEPHIIAIRDYPEHIVPISLSGTTLEFKTIDERKPSKIVLNNDFRLALKKYLVKPIPFEVVDNANGH